MYAVNGFRGHRRNLQRLYVVVAVYGFREVHMRRRSACTPASDSTADTHAPEQRSFDYLKQPEPTRRYPHTYTEDEIVLADRKSALQTHTRPQNHPFDDDDKPRLTTNPFQRHHLRIAPPKHRRQRSKRATWTRKNTVSGTFSPATTRSGTAPGPRRATRARRCSSPSKTRAGTGKGVRRGGRGTVGRRPTGR